MQAYVHLQHVHQNVVYAISEGSCDSAHLCRLACAFVAGTCMCDMLLSNLCEYACEWAYECHSAPILNDRKKFAGIRKHSRGVRKHSRGFAKIRKMLLKFARKVYSQHIREQS